MKDLLVLLAHLLTTIAKLLGPGGARAIVADSLLMKQQLLIVNRSRRRAPNLSALDRFLLDFWSLFLNPHRILRAAVIIRPSTLLTFHNPAPLAVLPGRYRRELLPTPGQDVAIAFLQVLVLVPGNFFLFRLAMIAQLSCSRRFMLVAQA
jgi:hypothetical protein